MTEYEKVKKVYEELKQDPSFTSADIFDKFLLGCVLKIFEYDNYKMSINPNEIQIICENQQSLYLRYIEKPEIEDSNIKEFIKFLNQKGEGNSDVYGILTNGSKFLLLNSIFYSIDALNGVIFRFDILSKRMKMKEKFFSYLTKKAIVDNRSVDNFKMIALFRANKIRANKTYGQYISTLESFFYFFAPPTCSERRSFEAVTTPDIYSFIEEKKKSIDINTGRKINKKNSIKNMYSHLNSFYKFLLEQGEIKRVPIDTKRSQVLKQYPNTQMDRHILTIDDEDIVLMINTLKKKRNAERNITMFSLCAYYGLERGDLYNLNWNNVKEYDAMLPHILIDNRKIPLCKFLINCFAKLRNIYDIDRNIKETIPVFTVNNENRKRLYEAAINDICKSFNKLSKVKGDKWEKICPQFLRFSLIQELQKRNFFVDEIVYITGINICNIGKYISKEEIIMQYNEREKENTLSLIEKLETYHPYAKVYNE